MSNLCVEIKVGELMEQPEYAGLLYLTEGTEASEVYFGIIGYLLKKGVIELGVVELEND